MSAITRKIDAAIIGSGLTGLAAALVLADGGATVAVFEKQRSFGGTSNFIHGTFAVESDMQRERFITYTRDEAFTGIMQYAHWRANPRLVRAIVNESAPGIAWLQRLGVVIGDATINMPEAPRTYHVIKGKGEAVVKAMVVDAKSKGVELLPETPATGLIKDGGRIVGLIAAAEGQEIEVQASAVVVATGGYANNREWIKKYTGYELGVDVIPIGNTGKTGDGIRMAWEAGAAEEGIGLLELFRVAPLAPEFSTWNDIEIAAAQPDLWVTADGERFCDETIGFYDTEVGNANARYARNGYTWSLMDDSILDDMAARGIDNNVGADFMPGYRPVNTRKEIQIAIENGTAEVVMAPSLEELAARMGADPEALRATLDAYNRCCDQDWDELFAKDRRYLRPLLGPNYYAVKARTVFLGTMGGIKVNEKLEVLDKKGRVVPGLYAGGFDAGGMYGDSYPIRASSGLASSFALNSGRIAGRSALAYAGK